MPKSLRLLAPLLLVAASCNSGAKLAAPKFAGPSALAVFHGYSSKHPGEGAPRPYLAVANLLRDELTVVDPLDNELVLSATLSFPLSVPTRPRPFKLAAAALEPPGAGERGADLLVVATQSPPSLQIVTTWTEELRAVDLPVDDDLAVAYPGTAVLSLAAVTRPGGGAWVLVGLSGGHLAVLEFERDPTSTLVVAKRPVRRTALQLQRKELVTGAGRFDPLDLAVAPDVSRLFVATTDPLHDGAGATISGVAQLTVAASAADAWPTVGLDARGPTRLVAAGRLSQRTVASSVVFESTPKTQIFAVLDEGGCGPRRAINCGLVTLLPDAGIAPDPAGELSYRAPVPLGGIPTALTLVMPRAQGEAGTPVGVAWDTSPAPAVDLMALSATSSSTGKPIRFWQTALLVVGLGDGRLLAVDPGRWGLVNFAQRRDADRRLLITSVVTSTPTTGAKKLGIWNDVARILDPGVQARVLVDATMNTQIRSTAGYLPQETFAITWQGALPDLSDREGILRWDGAQPVVAVQTGASAGARVHDPELGVRVGDRVTVVPSAATCALNGSGKEQGFVATVTAVQGPSATFPGGALALSHAGEGSSLAGDTACTAGAALVGAGAPGPLGGTLTVRAPGLVLIGGALGYLGRPELGVDFELRYQPEAGLTGEALAVARKLRRIYYPPDAPCGASIPGTETGDPPVALTYECDATLVTPPGADPLTPGPALKLRIGCDGQVVENLALVGPCAPEAGAQLLIGASSGLSAAAWVSPTTQGVTTALAWLDGSAVDPATTASRTSTVYASFTTSEVMSVVPRTASISSIR